MSDFSERLKLARREARFKTPTEAARAKNFVVSTYLGYENGDREPSKATAERIAAAFRVSLDWLLTGRGEMRGRRMMVPVMGCVGAGATVEFEHDGAQLAKADRIEMPREGEIAALVVKGDSQWPRFLDGEIILYDPTPVVPERLVGGYAIVQTFDGRKLIKILERGLGDNRWNLASHNAGHEKDVELIGAWRYLGVLPAR
jgi:phage repressor protein C with HTH and peptisase S24 domain